MSTVYTRGMVRDGGQHCSVVLGGRTLLCGAHVMQITVLMSTVVQSLALEQGGGRRQVWPRWDSQVVGWGIGEVLLGVGGVRVVVRGDRWELYMGVCVSCGCSLRQGGRRGTEAQWSGGGDRGRDRGSRTRG